jgi:hypothetical protein
VNGMAFLRVSLAGVLALILSSCAPSGTITKGEGVPVDAVMGDWQGHRVTSKGVVVPITAQAIALGQKNYRFVPITPSHQPDPSMRPVDVIQDGDRLLAPSNQGWEIKCSNGVISAVTKTDQVLSLELRRKLDLSPALGAKPPSGAVVLFDGTTLDGWQQRDAKLRTGPVGWKVSDGVVEVTPGTGDIITKRSFSDFQMHVEFRTPFMPEAQGQARGNSGVYLQGRYEVQVLDSYGLKGEDNECGGIYKVAAPSVNMCAPPGQWQTYDITFHAPRFDAAGTKTKDALLSVRHNGVVIHKDLVVPGPTGGAVEDDVKLPNGILLQDHGNLVQYRNIWLVELKD